MSEIILKNVHLHYPIYDMSSNDFRSKILSVATGGKIESGKTVSVHAINNVTIKFFHGDRVAILGGNGAGKTTLLRLIAGIYEPTSGEVIVDGKLSTLIDITLGMNEDLSGLQNIYCMSYVLEANKEEIEERINKIIEFSELGEFINLPVRTYSSGMRVRLAFSVISFMRSDILLIDEFFGAGDKNFIDKAKAKMFELVDHSSILVFVTHNFQLAKEICNKVLIMEKGKVKAYGNMATVGKDYFSGNLK